VSTTGAIEHIIRDLIADNPHLPIRADFFRGIRPTPQPVG
jgi:hypothetical protein